jgi:hypothetical protein
VVAKEPDELPVGIGEIGRKRVGRVRQRDQTRALDRGGQPAAVLRRQDPVLLTVHDECRSGDSGEPSTGVVGLRGRPLAVKRASVERVGQTPRDVLADARSVSVPRSWRVHIGHRPPQPLLGRNVAEVADEVPDRPLRWYAEFPPGGGGAEDERPDALRMSIASSCAITPPNDNPTTWAP